MKPSVIAQVAVTVEKDAQSVFLLLLQQEFMVAGEVGISMRRLLCDSLQLNPTYIDERIQTIFLDGQPVDNVDTAVVRDGATLALSAAMPGLVGATFRSGGPLAPFRSTISHRGNAADIKPGEGTVALKLFNLLIRELGPGFLKRGILIPARDLGAFLKALPTRVCRRITASQVDGRSLAVDELVERDWGASDGLVRLTVEVR